MSFIQTSASGTDLQKVGMSFYTDFSLRHGCAKGWNEFFVESWEGVFTQVLASGTHLQNFGNEFLQNFGLISR